MNPNHIMTTELNPQARLAISRRAIVRHMHHDDHDPEGQHESGPLIADSGPSGSGTTWGIIKHAFHAWWQHHPASTALELAAPVVSQYARDKPLRLLGIAAGAGAAIVVFRPWRLISLGGVLLAAMKSSDISSVLFSVLSSSPQKAANSTAKARP